VSDDRLNAKSATVTGDRSSFVMAGVTISRWIWRAKSEASRTLQRQSGLRQIQTWAEEG